MKPRLPEFRPDDIEGWANDLMRELEQYFEENDQPDGVGWTTANVTSERTFDANGSLAHIGDVVGTLIDDMKAAGRLKG